METIKILPRYRKKPKSKINNKKTTEQYKKEVKNVTPYIEVIDEYINSCTKINHKCLKCGYLWSAIPNNILKGKGCPECAKIVRGNKRKLTNDDYINKLKSYDSTIESCDLYVDSRTPILHHCLVCNYFWKAIPSNVLRRGCPICKRKSLQKTHDQYIKELSIKNTNIIVLETYIDTVTPILHKYIKCGHEIMIKPSVALLGFGCDKCNRNNIGNRFKLSQQEYEQKVYKNNPQIKILGEYLSATKRIKVQCMLDGFIWNPIAGSLSRTNYSGCPVCAGNVKYTHTEFMKMLSHVKNENVIVIGVYNGAKEKIECLCNMCGNIWSTLPCVLLSGCGCSKCGRVIFGEKMRLKNEEFINRMNDINPYINLESEYITAKDKVECSCMFCGFKWSSNAYDLLCGKGCPMCCSSHGEREIKKWLDKMSIDYNAQKKFDDLRGIKGKRLSYDFFIPSYNLLIEFQGEQHMRPIEYFGGEEQFKIQKEHDKRKREYSNLHNYNLLEIWYYDIDNIEHILTNKFNSIKSESVTTTGVA